eukprot:10434400-Prorocentrum_lima.AAC.1
MLRADDAPSPAPSSPPHVCDNEEPSGVLLQVATQDDTPPSIHTEPSLNDVALVSGTDSADKERHRIWLVNDTN